ETPKSVQRLVASVSAATFAVTSTYWSQAIIAEVYALHTVLIALIVWFTLRWQTQIWARYALAVTIGLGMAHHVTTILLIPAVVVYLLSQVDRPIKIATQSLIQYGALAAAPLLLYLYIPLIAPFTPYAHLTLSETQTLTLYDNSIFGFVSHITATAFAGELQPAAVGIERLKLVWQLLLQQVRWPGLILAAMGIITLWCRQRGLFGLTGLMFLAVIGFNLIYFIGDVFVLFIPAWLVVCIWIGVGILSLTHHLADRFVRQKIGAEDSVIFQRMRRQLWRNAYQIIALSLPLFFFALPIFLMVTNFAVVDQNKNTQAQTRWQEILAEPLPESAILLSNDRNEIMPMWYYQYVENRRPDLLGLFPLITPDPAYAHISGVLDQALSSGRPVYFIKPMDGLSLKANVIPEGTLYRATSLPEAPTYKQQQRLTDPSSAETISLMGYDLSATTVKPGETIEVTLYWYVDHPLAVNYTSYVHLISADGTGITQSDHQPGGDFYPSSEWQVGETLRDRHQLTLPSDIPAGEYRLRVGMYYQPGPGVIQPLGDGLEPGTLVVETAESQEGLLQ
ncbi:MAG: DUF2723 domain-containing protein, partial [Anaerolineae bacterium]|nr:DUF2723 domain-containing protein [Anaerolineae bacterium]